MAVLASALCGVCQPHLAEAWHRPAAKLPAGVVFGTDPADGSRRHQRLVSAEIASWKQSAPERPGAPAVSAAGSIGGGKAARYEQYSAGRGPCPRQFAWDWSPRVHSRCALRRSVW